MQTRKKNLGRNAKRDHASPRVSRMQKKASDNTQLPKTKVAELIASSPRKQKCVGAIPKKGGNQDLGPGCGLIHDENVNTCLDNDVTNISMVNEIMLQSYNEGTGCASGTIFSPAFHKSKASGGDTLTRDDFLRCFRSVDQQFHQDRVLDHSGADMLKSHDFEENPEHFSGGGKNYVAGSFHLENSSSNDEMEVDTIAAPDKLLNVNIGGDHNIYATDGHCTSDLGANLSSEVSAIYLAMKNSKLECVEEHAQDSISADVYVDAEACDEFDDFDPYLFIKNLPELSTVVPTFRRTLLPKRTRSCPRTSLVLDLDETLVHSTLEPCDDADFTFPVNFNFQEHTVYVRCRPHLRDFMERVSGLFEIIIFTASQSIYAEQLLNVLDPKRKIFRHRVFRDSCVYVDGNYLKDLSILGRDLAHVIIVDNSPQAFGFQVDNGIPIESWFDDCSDQELLLLLPFLESLVGVDDVRPHIAKKFNLREKVAAATYPFSSRISY